MSIIQNKINNDDNEYLTIGKLKEIIKDISDDTFVTIVDDYDMTKSCITKVSQVALLTCEQEDHDALGLCSDDSDPIYLKTSTCEKDNVLFSIEI